MNAEHVDDLIDLYALSALEPSEEARVDEHLEQCRSCSAKLADARRVVGLLAWSPEQVTPPRELQAKVIQRVERLQREHSTTMSQPGNASAATIGATPARGWLRRLSVRQWGVPRLGLAATGLLLLLLGAWNLSLQRQITTLRGAFHEQQAIASILQEPDARVEAMDPRDAAPYAQGSLILAPNRQTVYFVAYDLPQLEGDAVYQLWFYKDEERTDGGVFRPDENGATTLVVYSPSVMTEFTGCGITIEPAGGSNQPTGEYVLVSYW